MLVSILYALACLIIDLALLHLRSDQGCAARPGALLGSQAIGWSWLL